MRTPDTPYCTVTSWFHCTFHHLGQPRVPIADCQQPLRYSYTATDPWGITWRGHRCADHAPWLDVTRVSITTLPDGWTPDTPTKRGEGWLEPMADGGAALPVGLVYCRCPARTDETNAVHLDTCRKNGEWVGEPL